MIFLTIFLVLLTLILLVLFVNVHLILQYDEEPRVWVRVLFIKVDALDLAKSMGGEKKEKKKKKTKPKEPKEKKPRKKAKGSLTDFLNFIALITRIVSRAVADLLRKMRINLKAFDLRLTAGEADQTALLYAGAAQAVNALFALLSRFSHFRWDAEKMTLAPDFTAESSRFRIHLILTTKPVHLLGIVMRALFSYLEGKEV